MVEKQRFYFYFTGSTSIASASYGPNWNYTAETIRVPLAHFKVPDYNIIAEGTRIGPWTAGTLALDRQYISDLMMSGNQITGAITGFQLQVREFAAQDNVQQVRFNLKLVDNNGANRVVLLNQTITRGTNTEFVNNTNLQNNSVVTGNYAFGSSSLVSYSGDVLVVEIGYKDIAGTTPEAAANYGFNGASADTDLPVNATTTTKLSPWIEIEWVIPPSFQTVMTVIDSDTN